MKCPACENELTKKIIENMPLDVCEGGCGGVWFDWFELQKFDELAEPAGDEILNVPRDDSIFVDRSKRYKCPRCQNTIMMRHFFSIKQQVEVDECPGCGGFWLDAGELEKIRNLYESEQARHEAAEEHFADVFNEHFSKMEAEDQLKLEKAQKFARMFRFICPSYYIPGKQSWGAY